MALPISLVVVIYPPGAGTGAGQGSYSIAINREGALVGQWVTTNNLNHGFVWTP
jgi:hypothetical protein